MSIVLYGQQLNSNESLKYALTSMYGIGFSRAKSICQQIAVPEHKKVELLTNDEIAKLQDALSAYTITGKLKQEVKALNTAERSLKTYKAIRRANRLPVRGQRTCTNAKTARRISTI